MLQRRPTDASSHSGFRIPYPCIRKIRRRAAKAAKALFRILYFKRQWTKDIQAWIGEGRTRGKSANKQRTIHETTKTMSFLQPLVPWDRTSEKTPSLRWQMSLLTESRLVPLPGYRHRTTFDLLIAAAAGVLATSRPNQTSIEYARPSQHIRLHGASQSRCRSRTTAHIAHTSMQHRYTHTVT